MTFIPEYDLLAMKWGKFSYKYKDHGSIRKVMYIWLVVLRIYVVLAIFQP